MAASVAGFAHALRGLGIASTVPQVETAIGALGAIDPGDREDVYWALRSAFVSERESLTAFDAVFSAYWDAREAAVDEHAIANLVSRGGADRQSAVPDRPANDLGAAGREGREEHSSDWSEAGEPAKDEPRPGEAGGALYSPVEILRRRDFTELDAQERAEIEAALRRLGASLPKRLSRRMRPAARGVAIDPRATLRRAMRTGGQPITLAYERPATVTRRVVLILDVSGSMREYASPMLTLAQGMCRATRAVEVFALGTRLTRLTLPLARGNPQQALTRAVQRAPDWGGGTRIGEGLRRFNVHWGNRGLAHGAAVVICSDGWERGELNLLADQMAHLRRAAHTVIWVNPLAGDPDYQPLAAGMATALPYVDVFLPGHSLAALENLVDVLERLPAKGRTPRGLPARRRSRSGDGGRPGEPQIV